jgi:BMFP domain-containing protein YqiC
MRTKKVRPAWRARRSQWTEMDMNNFFNDLQGKINEAIENSPAKDIERNVKAMMTQGFSKLDLVTREEFDIQAQVLAKTRAKLDALELRVAELEAKLASEQKV